MNERICVICGKPIPSTRHKLTNTCSKECAWERSAEVKRNYFERNRERLNEAAREKYKKRAEISEKTAACKKCGAEFERSAPRQVYCMSCGVRGVKNISRRRRITALSKAERIARENGLSYGKAVAAGII